MYPHRQHNKVYKHCNFTACWTKFPILFRQNSTSISFFSGSPQKQFPFFFSRWNCLFCQKNLDSFPLCEIWREFCFEKFSLAIRWCVMNGLQSFKDGFPRLYRLADRCLVFFVLFPSVVAFWAGVWMFLDLHFYKDNVVTSAWSCVAIGIIILVFFNVVQYELTEQFLEPGGRLRNIVIKRLYTLVAGCANVFLCRGEEN